MLNLPSSHRGMDSFEWGYVGVIAGIVALGILSIYSVTSGQPLASFPVYAKQAIWVVFGFLAFFVVGAIDYHKLAHFSVALYGIGLLLLIVVLFEGKSSRGSQRWIPVGPFAIQPSEFVKFPFLLVMASYYAARARRGWWARVILPAFIALPGFLLILKQPDLGSSLSFLVIFITLLLAVGIKSKAFGLVLLSALMVFPFVWGGVWGSLHDYQKARIISFVDPAYDPGGKGYHGLQSRIAIGSGELVGKGLYGGTQTQFKFLPEGHTDFVFAVFAEEWGFLGGLLLFSLYLGLFLMGFEIAAKAKDLLGALLAIGVIGMIAFAMMVNIAMTLGLAPIVGIPLPLMSYGGSSTIMTMASLGLLLSIKRRRMTLLP